LAGGYLGPLKRRAGGGGAGEDAGFVAKQQFGIGADIDDQDHILGFVGFFGKGNGGAVSAHVACDAGQDINAGGVVDGGQIKIAGIQGQAG
jgi:hypothetical protein